EFTIGIKLGERRFDIRFAPTRHDEINQGGSVWYRYAGKFSGISADDWDAIVRFVNNQPEPTNKGADEIAAAMAKPDDAFRLLPHAIQEKIVDTLVQLNRMAKPPAGQAPLLRMRFVGSARKGNVEQHHCAVHSRITIDDEIRQFDTQFTIDSTGTVTAQR
ncbi:MAG: hypothetical protein JO101_07615, partial [Candidatus Eremiobacteraeota bacterium]|nr:hypothetical protein [Candidatus Eremiobacteraeota bacterium]